MEFLTFASQYTNEIDMGIRAIFSVIIASSIVYAVFKGIKLC